MDTRIKLYDLVQDIGFVRAAWAIQSLYDNDRINLVSARLLMAQLKGMSYKRLGYAPSSIKLN